MSLLDRYKKNGGFVQLLALLETCGEAKKEKFLSMILEENPAWHDALKQRILSLDKVLLWPPEILSEATSRTMPITLAAITKSLDDKDSKSLLTGLSHSHISKIREASENKAFTPMEIQSSIEKFLGETRKLITQGVIKLEKVAPDLIIPEKMEDYLDKLSLDFPTMPTANDPTPLTAVKKERKDEATTGTPNNITDDPTLLKKQLIALHREVTHLRQENQLLKEKLEQIRKIA